MAFKGFGTTTGTSGKSTGFSFGTPVASAVTTSTTTTNQVISTAGGTSTTVQSSSGGVTLGIPSTVPSTSSSYKGLGGVDVTTSGGANNGNNDKNSDISNAIKDQEVPNEISKYLNTFEEHIAKQKEESNEVAKFSARSLHKIREEISSLSVALATISSAVQRNNAAVEKLRGEFGEQLRNAEMAQNTQNTPDALQHDNVAPIRYFADLVLNFDSSMQLYRQQIEELENHLHSLSQTNLLTPQDISMALVKMQDSFIALASNLHSIHDDIRHLKEQYLAYRRVVHGDSTDIFAIQKESKIKANTEKVASIKGPPPFQNLSNVAALAMASMLQQPQQTPPQQGFLKPTFGQTVGNNPFGTSNTTTGGLFGNKAPATSSSSLFGSSSKGFGGFSTANALKPALSAGFNTSSSSGNVFFGNSTFNSSAGVTFGGAAARPQFDLKLPPAGNKRNKK